jgi:hypothetical protein
MCALAALRLKFRDIDRPIDCVRTTQDESPQYPRVTDRESRPCLCFPSREKGAAAPSTERICNAHDVSLRSSKPSGRKPSSQLVGCAVADTVETA